MKNLSTSNKKIKIYGPYTPAIRSGNFLFLSGQIPINKKNGEIPEKISEQTQLSLKNILYILKEHHLCIKNIIKITIFTTELKKLDAINQTYSNFFKKYTKIYPARSCIGVLVLPRNVSIEIEAIASYI
ncbi:RidA family protein [Buchnera aphidicola]|uniref:RidA family protein n=1 Tax=Buchnera aphidicola TaxID=9 RepID=UPI00094CEB83|nr:Rid family detoxifying hydrolase [Buchnera aphidicola]